MSATSAASRVPRPEHPRPDRRRERWWSLNGSWSFAFDDDDVGLVERWEATAAEHLERGGPFDRTITVPFAPQVPASGVDDRRDHPVVWYGRVLPNVEIGDDERLLLHVGAADHDARVWVNGRLVASHEGGYTPFTADVTHALGGDHDVCVVRVADSGALDQLRGKQFWRQPPEHVFYDGVTGIWQTVWLEAVHAAAVDDVALVPRLDTGSVAVTVTVTPAAVGRRLRITVRWQEHVVAADEVRLVGPEVRRDVRLSEASEATGWKLVEHQGVHVWTPWEPALYDVELAVLDDDGTALDRLETHLGMRTIEARDGRVLLNGAPIYQRLVLDQGYFPDGGYTATSDEHLRRDIELAKAMGFIGCRKHQKIEDPRWLWWADRLGFLVWEELPSAYRFTPAAIRRATSTWQEAVLRDRNHPCIVVWVPINESWGVPDVAWPSASAQHEHLRAMHHLTKAVDPTRLVVSNDGWEHATTDLVTVHEYGDPPTLRRRLSSRQRALDPGTARRATFVPGEVDRGAPLLLSEFGGVAVEREGGWGFHSVTDGEGLLEHYEAFVTAALSADDWLVGFCWTQLTDVEQEVNGLLTVDREPKAPLAALRAVTTRSRHGDPTTETD